MTTAFAPQIASNAAPRLAGEAQPLLQLEQALHAMTLALGGRDPAGLDLAAAQLQKAVADVATATTRPVGQPPAQPSPALRNRLNRVRARVLAQREAVARAAPSVDAALQVLFPQLARASVYDAAGAGHPRGAARGSIQA